jgi:transketolase
MINHDLKPANSSLRDAFGKTLIRIGEKYKNLVVFDVDLSSSTKTEVFSQQYPDRFFNIGIAEQNMTGIAMGMAAVGKISVISGFTCFTIGRAWEFIRAAAYDHLPLKVCTTHAGLSPDLDGGSHQALEDLSLMASIPGVHIFCPADPIEIEVILHKMMEIEGVCYLRLMRNALPWVFNPEKKEDFITNYNPLCPYVTFESKISNSEKFDITIMSTGSMTSFYPKIIAQLMNQHISSRVIHFPCIKPINNDMVRGFCNQTNHVVTIEEHNIPAGFGAQMGVIINQISKKNRLPILNIGVKDRFGQSGSIEQLYQEYGLDPISIANQILHWLLD